MFRPDDCAIFFNDERVLSKNEISFVFPIKEILDSKINFQEKDYIPIFRSEEKNIFAVSFTWEKSENGYGFIPVKDALKVTDHKTVQLISRGKQLLQWHRSSLYSGCCGSLTKLSLDEIAKICQDCRRIIYPETFPVIIVLIERGGEILLARSPHFSKGMYSTLAGFVDAGESCEAAIHREIFEEVGVEVGEISYFGSQSWPFPCSLLIGYLAKYKSGEICFDKMEIEDAQWFDISKLPTLPPEISISRHIIDHYVKRFKFDPLVDALSVEVF